MGVNQFVDAIGVLKAGKPIVFPTDTVYGIGVAVEYADSPRAIYDIKGREGEKPVAWLVGGPEALDKYAKDVPESVRQKIDSYWPGALTVVVKASDEVPPAFRADDGSIGLRMPANETALRLIRIVGPIATSSANPSGETAPCIADDLDPDLLFKVNAVITDNTVGSGIASTVLDCTKDEPTVIRQGAVAGDSAQGAVFTVPFEFVSHSKKARVNAKLWTSTRFGGPNDPGFEDPKAVIQIVPDIAECIDQYDEFARYLVDRGFVVCAHDHAGHGGTAIGPDDYGHVPLRNGKKILVGDAHTLHRMVARTFPDVPQVMYGHSIGALIVRAYIAHHGNELAACVLSGMGAISAGRAKMGSALARFIASIGGDSYRSGLFDGIGVGTYGKSVPVVRMSPGPAQAEAADADAEGAAADYEFKLSVGGYAALFGLAEEVVTSEYAESVPKELPVLFVSGKGGSAAGSERGANAAAQLLRNAGVETVDCKTFEIANGEASGAVAEEAARDEVVAWIESHVSRS